MWVRPEWGLSAEAASLSDSRLSGAVALGFQKLEAKDVGAATQEFESVLRQSPGQSMAHFGLAYGRATADHCVAQWDAIANAMERGATTCVDRESARRHMVRISTMVLRQAAIEVCALELESTELQRVAAKGRLKGLGAIGMGALTGSQMESSDRSTRTMARAATAAAVIGSAAANVSADKADEVAAQRVIQAMAVCDLMTKPMQCLRGLDVDRRTLPETSREFDELESNLGAMLDAISRNTGTMLRWISLKLIVVPRHTLKRFLNEEIVQIVFRATRVVETLSLDASGSVELLSSVRTRLVALLRSKETRRISAAKWAMGLTIAAITFWGGNQPLSDATVLIALPFWIAAIAFSVLVSSRSTRAIARDLRAFSLAQRTPDVWSRLWHVWLRLRSDNSVESFGARHTIQLIA